MKSKRSAFGIKQIFYVLIIFLMVGLAWVLLFNEFDSPSFISQSRKPKSLLCLSHLRSISDTNMDTPPYGDLVFIDKHACLTGSLFQKKKATQIFGGFCKKLELGWEPDGSAKVRCATEIAELKNNVKLKVKKFESTDIIYEFIDDSKL